MTRKGTEDREKGRERRNASSNDCSLSSCDDFTKQSFKNHKLIARHGGSREAEAGDSLSLSLAWSTQQTLPQSINQSSVVLHILAKPFSLGKQTDRNYMLSSCK